MKTFRYALLASALLYIGASPVSAAPTIHVSAAGASAQRPLPAPMLEPMTPRHGTLSEDVAAFALLALLLTIAGRKARRLHDDRAMAS